MTPRTPGTRGMAGTHGTAGTLGTPGTRGMEHLEKHETKYACLVYLLSFYRIKIIKLSLIMIISNMLAQQGTL